MKTKIETKLYTTFEDQRAIPILGFSSISVAIENADKACQWFEEKFGITLHNWEVWTEESPDSDLIIHKPEAMEYIKNIKPRIKTFLPIERKTREQSVAEAMFKIIIIICSAILITCGVILSAL